MPTGQTPPKASHIQVQASSKSPLSKKPSEESVPTAQDATIEKDAATNGTNGTLEATHQETNDEPIILLEESTSGLVKEVGAGPTDDPRRSPKDVESECRDEYNASSGEKQVPDETPLEESSRDCLEETESELEVLEQHHSVYRRMFYMGHFHSSDIVVQSDGHTVLIAGYHGPHADEHGFVTRTFYRKHNLPEETVAEKLTSFLTGDGVLVIQAPYMEEEREEEEEDSIQPEASV